MVDVRSMMAAMGERPIAFYPALARLTGSVKTGIFLSQLMYWAPRGRDPEWHYKSMTQWQEETTLSRYEIEQARKTCIELGVLEEELRDLPARLFYRLDWERLAELLAGDSPLRSLKTDVQVREELTNITLSETPAETPYLDSGRESTGAIAPRAKKEPITEEFLETLCLEYDPLLGGMANDSIEAALNHTALNKAIDKRLYLRRWLDRDVARRNEKGASNGRVGAYVKRPESGHPESDPDEYAEFRAFNK